MSRYRCCHHCPAHHTDPRSPWANQGHDYPCRDLHCEGWHNQDETQPQEEKK